MTQRWAALVALTLCALPACNKDKPPAPAPVVAADVGPVEPPKKEDPALAAKLAIAYPQIRCMLASGQRGPADLYTKAGFPTSEAFLTAFQIQADANPAWARGVISAALAKPCPEVRGVPAPEPQP